MTSEFASTYRGLPTAPSQARSWSQSRIRAAVGQHPRAAGVVDEATIVVSELVTNAVQAGCSVARLTLAIDDERVRIAVSDDVSGLPRRRDTGPADEHGRGLQIVEALCADWGVANTTEGKRVWAELRY
ncbi:MAG: ATP-binding protein [Actinomycetota bacterium]|nr:ATP-binding protein [Actinomycetota bacterium]